MADLEQDYLTVLEQGVKAWNKWRETNREIKFNLKAVNLSEANLRGADLGEVNLSGANLSGANLSGANLLEADLSGADLTSANLSGADLFGVNLKVADLIGTNLIGTNLIGANLKGANLREADLKGADLRGANLCGTDLCAANFRGADLSRTDLSITQVIKTNFEGAKFTGACIKDWNINSTTKLERIICDFVYLKEGEQNRRPHDLQKNFASGEFTQLFQKKLETVDLVFSDGIDWQIFFASFQSLQVEYAGELLGIQTMEHESENTFLLRLEISPDANKVSIEEFFWQHYQPLLTRKNGQIAFYRPEIRTKHLENTKLLKIIETMAEKEVSQVEMIFQIP